MIAYFNWKVKFYTVAQIAVCVICFFLPGINLFMWRWKLSREVDPLAHLYTGRMVPPFFKVPVCVYRCTPSGSWMQETCRCWTLHTSAILSLSNKGTPNVSHPRGPSNDWIKPDISFWVSSVPLVIRLQWSASSVEERCRLTSFSEGLSTPWRIISSRLAVVSSWRSSSSHLKTHWLSLPMKMLYKGCLSVVQPEGNRRIKCQMSNLRIIIVYYD